MNNIGKNHMNKLVWIAAALVGAAIGVSACKKAQNDRQSVKGVENLANDGKKFPSPICGSTSIDDAHKVALDAWLKDGRAVDGNGRELSADSDQVKEFRAALAYAPVALINAMAMMKVKVNFVTGIPAECSQIKNSPDEKFFREFTKNKNFSCAIKVEGEQNPAIFMGTIDDEAAYSQLLERYGLQEQRPSMATYIVRHEAVRNMAVVYARILRLQFEKLSEGFAQQGVALMGDDATSQAAFKAQVDSQLTEYEHSRELLEGAFVADVNNSFDAKVSANLAAMKRELGEKFFRDYVLAEVMDSYYCNAETYGSLATKYNGTLKTFVDEFVQGKGGLNPSPFGAK